MGALGAAGAPGAGTGELSRADCTAARAVPAVPRWGRLVSRNTATVTVRLPLLARRPQLAPWPSRVSQRSSGRPMRPRVTHGTRRTGRGPAQVGGSRPTSPRRSELPPGREAAVVASRVVMESSMASVGAVGTMSVGAVTVAVTAMT